TKQRTRARSTPKPGKRKGDAVALGKQRSSIIRKRPSRHFPRDSRIAAGVVHLDDLPASAAALEEDQHADLLRRTQHRDDSHCTEHLWPRKEERSHRAGVVCQSTRPQREQHFL